MDEKKEKKNNDKTEEYISARPEDVDKKITDLIVREAREMAEAADAQEREKIAKKYANLQIAISASVEDGSENENKATEENEGRPQSEDEGTPTNADIAPLFVESDDSSQDTSSAQDEEEEKDAANTSSAPSSNTGVSPDSSQQASNPSLDQSSPAAAPPSSSSASSPSPLQIGNSSGATGGSDEQAANEGNGAAQNALPSQGNDNNAVPESENPNREQSEQVQEQRETSAPQTTDSSAINPNAVEPQAAGQIPEEIQNSEKGTPRVSPDMEQEIADALHLQQDQQAKRSLQKEGLLNQISDDLLSDANSETGDGAPSDSGNQKIAPPSLVSQIPENVINPSQNQNPQENTQDAAQNSAQPAQRNPQKTARQLDEMRHTDRSAQVDGEEEGDDDSQKGDTKESDMSADPRPGSRLYLSAAFGEMIFTLGAQLEALKYIHEHFIGYYLLPGIPFLAEYLGFGKSEYEEPSSWQQVAFGCLALFEFFLVFFVFVGSILQMLIFFAPFISSIAFLSEFQSSMPSSIVEFINNFTN